MKFRVLAAVCAAATLSGLAHASTAIFWHVSTHADFLKGEVDSLSIDSDGRVLLGPAQELVQESTAPFLWSLVGTSDGALWAGSGNEGKVFRLGKDGKLTTVYDGAELEVHALAPAPDAGVYAGTSPDGKIYKIAANGTATTFFDPEGKYIWALAVASDGTVYAGTGDKGAIYRMTPDGKGSVLYRTKATHVTALMLDREGNLLAGTESPGQVIKVDRQGKAFVVLDSPHREIHALRADDKGIVYAAAVSGRPSPEDRPPDRGLPTEPPRTPTPSVSTEITSISIVDVSVPSTPSPSPTPRREDRRSVKGAVYRIAPDGAWDVVWESSDDVPYDLTFDAGGALLIGTGSKGKIFRVAGAPAKPMLLGRAPAQQITAFLRQGAQHYYATANPGKIFKLSSARAEKGVYESEIRDATTVATWGAIRWRAATPSGSQIQLFSRSGNTAAPDETWSEWSAAYTRADGEQITSPKARYLQWKAVITAKSDSPILTSVTAAYLQRNLRPEVASITVHPPGTVFQKPFSTGELEIAGYEDAQPDTRPQSSQPPGGGVSPSGGAPALGRRVYQKGLQAFVWKAEDDNDDRLQFDVLYRREGETTWKMLKRGIDDPILVWDTSSVPDGTYMIKVVASDAPSNSPGTALTGELESAVFEIDNSAPTIEVTNVQRQNGQTVIAFVVRDDHSPVQRVEYSLDATRWRVIYPKDGIADSRVEQFEVTLDGDATSRSVILRATDAMSNLATALGEIPARSK